MYKDFIDIGKQVESGKKPVLAVAAAAESSLLKAVVKAVQSYLAGAILTGNSEKIKELANQEKISLEKIRLIDTDSKEKACQKAVQLVNEGNADFVMKGLVDTSVFLKAIIDKEKGLMSGHLLSSVMALKLDTYHKMLIITDGGMVIAPDLEQKKEIIKNAVMLSKALGLKTIKVAALAAKEKVNPKMPATIDADELKQLSEKDYWGKEVIVDGPMAMDLAVSKDAAITKGYQSIVAGDADIILVPNIETGNALIKALTCLGNAELAGVVMGACAPVVLTSRSESEENKLNSIILGAYIAQQTGNCHDKREE